LTAKLRIIQGLEKGLTKKSRKTEVAVVEMKIPGELLNN
jgi:hypothetical protein